VDINDLRTVLTVLAFVSFLGICVWAYSRRARKGFDEAEMLPFSEDEEFPVGEDADGAKQGKRHG